MMMFPKSESPQILCDHGTTCRRGHSTGIEREGSLGWDMTRHGSHWNSAAGCSGNVHLYAFSDVAIRSRAILTPVTINTRVCLS